MAKTSTRSAKAKPAKQADPLLAEKSAVDEKIGGIAELMANDPSELLYAHYQALCNLSGALAERIAANKQIPGA